MYKKSVFIHEFQVLTYVGFILVSFLEQSLLLPLDPFHISYLNMREL